MDLGNNPISSSFEEIKKSLDLACSYMIFEKDAGSMERGEFQEIMVVLSRLKKWTLEQEIHCDEARGRLLLVVKLEPNQTDKIIQEFLNIRLPKDITFYVYGSHPKE